MALSENKGNGLIIILMSFLRNNGKKHDRKTMNHVHRLEFIGKPKSKAMSITCSDERLEVAKSLFEKHFTK